MENKKYFEKIDELYEKYLKVWEDVCNIESPTENKEGVDKVCDYFVQMAKERGWQIEVNKQEVAGSPVCITINPNVNEKPFTISGHVDTVFKIGAFGYPPVKMDEENMYGPGVCDCKGGVVAGFMAMDVLWSCGYDKRPIKMIIQTDEEGGSSASNGQTIKYLLECAKDSVAVINLEGSGSVEGKACVQRKGIITCTLKVKGQEAHSSKCFEAGANAILETAHKIIELEKLKDGEGITCNCAVINGGTKVNVVPGSCELKINIRYANEEQYDYVMKYLQEIEKKVYVKGCTSEFVDFSNRPCMQREQRNLDLLDKINGFFKECGLSEVQAGKRTGGSDAAYFTIAGIPCLDNFGTGGGKIHSTSEYSPKESLRLSAKQLVAIALGI